jgi:hypothetical protein
MMKFNIKKKEEKLTEEIIVFNDKIEGMQQELNRKSKQIFELELEVSKVKFSSYKYQPKLSICNVANQNIPPATDLPAPPKPHVPKLTCVTMKSTCDAPECQNHHRPCFYTGMPKPWYDDP